MSLPLKLIEYLVATIQFTCLFLSFLFFMPILALLTLDLIVYIIRISKLLTNINQLKALFNLGSEISTVAPVKEKVNVGKITVQQGVVYEEYVITG